MKSGIFVTTVNDKSIYSFLIETICRKHKIQNKDLIYIFNFKKNFHFQILIKFIKIFFFKIFFLILIYLLN